jgi:DNA primase
MDFVEHLKSQVDIVQTIQTYVKLRRVGHRYTGLCPFHSEKSPSFSVNADLQFYHCFGCKAGGDVLKFIEQIEHVSFYEALKLLAERNGVPMPKRAEYSDPESKLRGAIMTMHEIAEQEFRELLRSPQGAEARAYIAKRGVAPDMVEHFGLGYSDRSGRWLVRAFERHSFTQEQLDASGLVMRRENGGGYYDRFRNRLMFPIHNESGKCIGFGGRALDAEDNPKYLNSPETPVYKKSNVLYNLHRAKEGIRKSDRSILVEGYMDAIGVYAAGVHEVVASCGTALTNPQVRMLKRHSSNITVNFDPDAAGESAAERSIKLLLDEAMHVRIMELDEDLDPDEYCKKHGAEGYEARLKAAKTYFYWLADRARAKYPERTSEARVAIFQFLLPAIQGIPDKLERAAVANDVAGYLGIERGLVLENFRKMAVERQEKEIRRVREPLPDTDRILLALMLTDADALAELLPQLQELPAVRTSPARRIYEALFAVAASGVPVTFAQVHGRLEDEDRERLSETLFREGVPPTLHDGLACLETLRASFLNSERDRIRAVIREAERSGNLHRALSLIADNDRIFAAIREAERNSDFPAVTRLLHELSQLG